MFGVRDANQVKTYFDGYKTHIHESAKTRSRAQICNIKLQTLKRKIVITSQL